VCKKLKSFTEEIFKKLSESANWPFLNRFVTMATGIFNYFIFRNSRYCSSDVAEFRDHTLQDDKFLIQLCAVQLKLSYLKGLFNFAQAMQPGTRAVPVWQSTFVIV
jgi:hypothetical protein